MYPRMVDRIPPTEPISTKDERFDQLPFPFQGTREGGGVRAADTLPQSTAPVIKVEDDALLTAVAPSPCVLEFCRRGGEGSVTQTRW